MPISLFDLYKIGVGPSSSHTMGPMRAACRFARGLADGGLLDGVVRVQAELFGSLALTGLGHATDRAVILGLCGNEPAAIDPALIESTVAAVRAARRIDLAGNRSIPFNEPTDLLFHRDAMYPPCAQMQHPNGLRFTAFDEAGVALDARTYFSIGGGFIVEDGEKPNAKWEAAVPFPFRTAADLLASAHAHDLSISQLMLENECALVSRDSNRAPVEVVREGIDRIW
ncbi:MAG: serine dehydratase beta chain, partial [Terracidiphilus sp.]